MPDFPGLLPSSSPTAADNELARRQPVTCKSPHGLPGFTCTASQFSKPLTLSRSLPSVTRSGNAHFANMFKRSFASKDRAGKTRKISKRSFRDDAKMRMREVLAASPETSPSVGG